MASPGVNFLIQFLKRYFVVVVCCHLIFLLSRLLMLAFFGNKELWTVEWEALLAAYTAGLRFDIKFITVFIAPFYLLALVFLAPPFRAAQGAFLKVFTSYCRFLFVFSFFGAIINHYYYLTYQGPIDEFIFGVIDGEPAAVLKSVWADYPVVKGIVLFSLMSWFLLRGQKKMDHWMSRQWPIQVHWNWWKGVLLVVGSLIIVFVGGRGSIGVFPLSSDWARVSRLKLVNDIVPNGPFAFYWALRDRIQQESFPPAKPMDAQRYVREYFNTQTNTDWRPENLFTRTPKSDELEKRSLHVVFTLMEGFGSHVLDWQSESFNILGRLDKHFAEDYVFNDFLSGGDGTFPSLIRLLVSSKYMTLTRSKARRTAFKTSSALPYKMKGYRCYFVTSGNAAWRGLSGFLQHNGYDEVIDSNDLQRKYVGVVQRDWGVDDEYAYRYAQELLEAAADKGEKVFVFIMTISNHPPYEVPDHYKPLPLQTPLELKDFIKVKEPEKVQQILAAYQYANSAYGDFLTFIKSGSLKDDVIVAASGDHNLRHLAYHNSKDYFKWHQVPFHLYVPERLRGLLDYEPNQLASQKDIFPTLYHLSLSDSPYLNLGRNLFAPEEGKGRQVAINQRMIASEEGAADTVGQFLFFPWKDRSRRELGLPIESEFRDSLRLQYRAYNALLDWISNYQINDPMAFSHVFSPQE